MRTKDLAILTVVFLVSLVPRKDLFYSPPGNHHESVNAHLLITHYAWQQGQNSLFFPRYSFQHPNSKAIPVLGGVKDEKGNYYYVSYPPGIFVTSGLLLSVLPGPPQYLHLRVLSVVTHFITAVFFFLFLSAVFRHTGHPYWLHLAAGFYIFTTGNLWLYSYFFFADTLVLVFLLAASFFLLRWISSPHNNQHTPWWYLLFFSLACFTEWMSFFYGLSACLFVLLRKEITVTRKRYFIFVTSLSFFIMAGGPYLLYSGIAGTEPLVTALKNKLAVRSGFADTHEVWFRSNFFSLTAHRLYFNSFLKNHLLLFQFTALFFVAFVWAVWFRRKRSKQPYLSTAPSFAPIFFLLVLPCLLHYMVFTNFSVVHEFSQIKFSLVFCACAAFCAARFAGIFHVPASIAGWITVLAFLTFSSVSVFYLEGLTQRKPNHAHTIGLLTESIRQRPEKELLLVKMNFYPEVVFNTKRFYVPVISKTEAEKVTAERQANAAVYIYPDSTGHRLLYERIK